MPSAIQMQNSDAERYLERLDDTRALILEILNDILEKEPEKRLAVEKVKAALDEMYIEKKAEYQMVQHSRYFQEYLSSAFSNALKGDVKNSNTINTFFKYKRSRRLQYS